MQWANPIDGTANPNSKSYIVIADLEVECIIGIYPHERATPQKLRFDVRLDLDIGEAAAVDDIGSTTDYDDIAHIVSNCAINGRYQLVETCVTNIVDQIKRSHPQLHAVSVIAKKPAANPRAAYVSIERHDWR